MFPVAEGKIPNRTKSNTPPENDTPAVAPHSAMIQNENPAINTWNPKNRIGARNRNVNSIGSVIPVRNDVSAAAPIIEIASCLFSFLAAITIAAPAAGSPNIMNGNLPCRYAPGCTPSVMYTCPVIGLPSTTNVILVLPLTSVI